jgi:hypothetical protein
VRYIINADAAAPTKVIGVLWLTKTFTELLGNWCGNIGVVFNAEIGYVNFCDTFYNGTLWNWTSSWITVIKVTILGDMLCNMVDIKHLDTKDDCTSYQQNVTRLLQVSHSRMLPLLDSLPRELHKSPPTSLGSVITPTQENYVSVRSDMVKSHSHIIFSF